MECLKKGNSVGHSLLRSVFDVPNVQWLEGLRAMNEDYLSLGIELRCRCRLVDVLPDSLVCHRTLSVCWEAWVRSRGGGGSNY